MSRVSVRSTMQFIRVNEKSAHGTDQREKRADQCADSRGADGISFELNDPANPTREAD